MGSPETRRVDVRVIAATNRDLHTLVEKKQFREDLYYRLSMVEIKLPRLADRKEDLPLLKRHFVERFAVQFNKPIRGLTRRAQTLLTSYSWPGNVRELENVLGHACMMAQGETIDVQDLPENLRNPSSHDFQEGEEPITLEEIERRHARRVLQKVGGNKAKAAELLGVSRATIYRLLDESTSHEKEN